MKLVSIVLVCLALASPVYAQEHQKVLDWTSLIAAAAASNLDNVTTIHALNTGCGHEGNAIYSQHPSSATLLLSTGAVIGLLTAASYYGEHSHRKLSRWYSRGLNWGVAALETSVTIHNARLCGF